VRELRERLQGVDSAEQHAVLGVLLRVRLVTLAVVGWVTGEMRLSWTGFRSR